MTIVMVNYDALSDNHEYIVMLHYDTLSTKHDHTYATC